MWTGFCFGLGMMAAWVGVIVLVFAALFVAWLFSTRLERRSQSKKSVQAEEIAFTRSKARRRSYVATVRHEYVWPAIPKVPARLSKD